MKKFFSSLLVVLFAIGFITSIAKADLIVLDSGTYTAPENNSTIASHSSDLDHFYYYTWCLEDLSSESLVGGKLEIVFHGIHDWRVEEDYLNVFIRDGGQDDVLGWNSYGDGSSLSIPDWSSDPTWSSIGVWSDPAGHEPEIDGPIYDVVFTLNIDSTWAEYLSNGGSFVIGIDPDCHYYVDQITVNAPVPEPTTLLLLGSGLLGLAGYRRKNSKS